MNFPLTPTTKHAISQRKNIAGVGINDAWYVISPIVEGVQIICPIYQIWVDMIKRCYSKRSLLKRPTYAKVSVTQEWLKFSNFRKWVIGQPEWLGLQLDKDVLFPGNKIYGPHTCRFVTSEVNSVLLDRGANRGKYPLGVSFDKRRLKFLASCSVAGKKKFIGYFLKSEDASLAYRKFKANVIRELAAIQHDKLIRNGLLHHAELILEN